MPDKNEVKKQRFRQALAEFYRIMQDDGAATVVLNATKRVNDVENALPRHINPAQWMGAVKMYECRRDEHQGETALLFDPETVQRKLWHRMIRDVKEHYTENSQEHKAALEAENVLNQVWENAYLSPATVKPSRPLRVSGYARGGAVFREREDGCLPIWEVPSRWVPGHIKENNLLQTVCQSNGDATGEIAAICDNGQVKTFHMADEKRLEMLRLIMPRLREKQPELCREGCVPIENTSALKLLDSTILDELAQRYPLLLKKTERGSSKTL